MTKVQFHLLCQTRQHSTDVEVELPFISFTMKEGYFLVIHFYYAAPTVSVINRNIGNY